MMLNKASAYIWTLGNNICTKKSSPANIYSFKVNNKALGKGVKLTINMFKVNNKDIRTTLLSLLLAFNQFHAFS